MPIYTCTIAESTLSSDTKRDLAGEIARIHSSIVHVPSTYVNVAFHELATDGLYTDGVPASPVLVSGWVRAGHPEKDTTRLCHRNRHCCFQDLRYRRGTSARRHPKQPGAFRRGRRTCSA